MSRFPLSSYHFVDFLNTKCREKRGLDRCDPPGHSPAAGLRVRFRSAPRVTLGPAAPVSPGPAGLRDLRREVEAKAPRRRGESSEQSWGREPGRAAGPLPGAPFGALRLGRTPAEPNRGAGKCGPQENPSSRRSGDQPAEQRSSDPSEEIQITAGTRSFLHSKIFTS